MVFKYTVEATVPYDFNNAFENFQISMNQPLAFLPDTVDPYILEKQKSRHLMSLYSIMMSLVPLIWFQEQSVIVLLLYSPSLLPASVLLYQHIYKGAFLNGKDAQHNQRCHLTRKISTFIIY